MSLSVINISEIQSIINNLSFEKVKQETSNLSVSLKEKQNEEHGNLYMLVNDKSASKNSNIQNQCNGLILEKESNNVVCACYHKIVDLELEDYEETVKKYTDFKIEYCEDGTMIRLYNYKNKWYTATARCMDARDSIWASSKSFDEMFWEVFDKDLLDSLNTSYTYVFILLHTDNRIVVRHLKNELVYLLRIQNQTLLIDEDFDINHDCIRRPQAFSNFDIKTFHDYSIFMKRGVMVKCFNKHTSIYDIYKIDFDQYKTIKHVRGNVPNIRMRFLELLTKNEELVQLEKYYPEHAFLFSAIRYSLMSLVNRVHHLYIESHIKHSIFVYEPHPYYRTLRQLHAQFKAYGIPITYTDVQNKVFGLDKNVIKQLLGWVN